MSYVSSCKVILIVTSLEIALVGATIPKIQHIN